MTLKEARRQRKLSQKDLAAIVQISPTSLSFIENYKKFPRAETRKRLRKIFGNELELYPASVLVGMISRFIGSDPKLGPYRARFLKSEIDKVVQCIEFDIVKFKTTKL